MVDYTASGLEKMRKAYVRRKVFLFDLKKKEKNKVVVLLTNSMFYILIRPKR